MQGIARDYVRSVEDQINDADWDEIRAKFDDDYGDESLWEGHKKSVIVKRVSLYVRFTRSGEISLDHAIHLQMEKGRSLWGVKIADLADEVESELGLKLKVNERALPFSFVEGYEKRYD